MKFNANGTEKKINKTFKIEQSIYNQFKEKLRVTQSADMGLTVGAWIRKQMILFDVKKES